jgi:hypothetical protein
MSQRVDMAAQGLACVCLVMSDTIILRESTPFLKRHKTEKSYCFLRSPSYRPPGPPLTPSRPLCLGGMQGGSAHRSLMERGPKKRGQKRGAEAVPAVLEGFNEQDLAMKLLPYLPLRELAVVAMVSRSWRACLDTILRRLRYALWVAPLRQRLDFSGQIMPAEAANLGLDKLLNNLIVLNGLRHR